MTGATKRVTREYMNPDSGEVVTLEHEEAVAPRRKREDAADENFAMVFNLSEVANMGLSLPEFRALFWLIDRAPIEKSAFMYRNRDLAEQTGSHPTKTSQAVQGLKRKGLIIERGSRHVMLNPAYFWKGKGRDRRRMIWNVESGHLPPAIDTPR